jgi:hypothetical protein
VSKAKPEFALVCALVADDRQYDQLEAELLAGSNLPGPRANLALAAAFADCVAAEGTTEPQWALLTAWLAIAEDEAPTGNPREYLPFCAVQALGACFPDADPDRRAEVVTRLREVANDGRWRLREAVTIALQRIGEWNFDALAAILESWLPDATFLEQRAIVAALAHPSLLRSPDQARRSLGIADRVVANLAAVESPARNTGAFKVLKQGLGFAPSLLVAALPEVGFTMLEQWIATGDRDVQAIVRDNLKKDRLKRCSPDRVEALLART